MVGRDVHFRGFFFFTLLLPHQCAESLESEFTNGQPQYMQVRITTLMLGFNRGETTWILLLSLSSSSSSSSSSSHLLQASNHCTMWPPGQQNLRPGDYLQAERQKNKIYCIGNYHGGCWDVGPNMAGHPPLRTNEWSERFFCETKTERCTPPLPGYVIRSSLLGEG